MGRRGGCFCSSFARLRHKAVALVGNAILPARRLAQFELPTTLRL